jgi:chromosome segregation ATPase
LHHEECNDIRTLEKAAADVKKSEIIADLGSRMKEALQTLGELTNHKHENIGMINAQRDGIKSSLNELRRNINDYFDSLEKRMNEKLLQAHGECIQKLEEQTKDLEKRTETLKTWQSDIQIIKEFGSDKHAFVMSKELENLVTELETFNNISTENFIGLNLTFLTSITVENLQALGEISVNKSSTELIITSKTSGRLRSKWVER